MKIYSCLDNPVRKKTYAPGEWIEISGWGFREDKNAQWAEIRIDESIIQFIPFNRSRPDVLDAGLPAKKLDVNTIGFHAFYQLPRGLVPGDHSLEVFIWDEQGTWGKIIQTWLRVRTPVNKGVKNQAKMKTQVKKDRQLAVDINHKSKFQSAKLRKLEKIKGLLRMDLPVRKNKSHYNYLTTKLKNKYGIVHSPQVSQHEYDSIALPLIHKLARGMVLDCGSGRRSQYYSNVVNFEIEPYPSTDVLGVNEDLPFKDNAFDAVLSLSVLEHVKDPFACAREIVRVLKPGGQLYCSVPFLQPLHAYPNHYYNMSMEGLENLFGDKLNIEQQAVLPPGYPIWALNWILNSWANGLPAGIKEGFMEMKIKDLMKNPIDQLQAEYINRLSVAKNEELATATMLLGRKNKENRRD